MTIDEDTLIIVTADHEHAIAFDGYRGSPILGLCYEVHPDRPGYAETLNKGADGKPHTVIGFLNGAGSRPEGAGGYVRARCGGMVLRVNLRRRVRPGHDRARR